MRRTRRASLFRGAVPCVLSLMFAASYVWGDSSFPGVEIAESKTVSLGDRSCVLSVVVDRYTAVVPELCSRDGSSVSLEGKGIGKVSGAFGASEKLSHVKLRGNTAWKQTVVSSVSDIESRLWIDGSEESFVPVESAPLLGVLRPGSAVPVSVTVPDSLLGAPVRDGQGAVVGVVSVVRDEGVLVTFL